MGEEGASPISINRISDAECRCATSAQTNRVSVFPGDETPVLNHTGKARSSGVQGVVENDLADRGTSLVAGGLTKGVNNRATSQCCYGGVRYFSLTFGSSFALERLDLTASVKRVWL